MLAASFESEPGVKKVIRATEEIRKIERATDVVRWIVLGAGIVLLGTGLLLILNTIRMAMFARRREIEVMKLVGATNWFILVPFMLEGTVQGSLAPALGSASVYGANKAFERWLASDNVLNILQSFAVESARSGASPPCCWSSARRSARSARPSPHTASSTSDSRCEFAPCGRSCAERKRRRSTGKAGSVYRSLLSIYSNRR